jgi:hypothetical protein
MAHDDLIALAEAALEYQVSEGWLRKQVREKKLIAYEKPGDRRTFLSRSALREFMMPRPRDSE